MLREALRKRRNELGLTQEDVGRACNVGRGAAARWEKDVVPPTTHWECLAEILKVDYGWLAKHMQEPYEPEPRPHVSISNTATGGSVNMGAAGATGGGKSPIHDAINSELNKMDEDAAKKVLKFILGMD